MSSRKRKHQSRTHHARAERDTSPEHEPDNSNLVIQAYEADLVRGPKAALAARSLEIYREGGQTFVGSGLIRRELPRSLRRDEKSENDGGEGGEEEVIWVDRYDARLLLESLPNFEEDSAMPVLSSPSGWSDLPSDSEDTFFLSPAETEELRHEKRRRLMEHNREERMRAIREQEGEEELEAWGESDEEVTEEISTLMQRTASHMADSSNPAQLTARILANHGADTRFAFLRGRWSRAWALTQATQREARAKEKAKEDQKVAGMLVGYGESDEEPEERAEEYNGASKVGEHPGGLDLLADEQQTKKAATDRTQEDDAQKARRIRAKLWAEQRRAAKATILDKEKG